MVNFILHRFYCNFFKKLRGAVSTRLECNHIQVSAKKHNGPQLNESDKNNKHEICASHFTSYAKSQKYPRKCLKNSYFKETKLTIVTKANVLNQYKTTQKFSELS